MLSGSNTHLSKPEWAAVSLAFIEADKARAQAEPGPVRACAGKVVRLFTRTDPRPAQPLDPKTEAVQLFITATHRRRSAAVEYVPRLVEHGFNQAQIEALTLLAA